MCLALSTLWRQMGKNYNFASAILTSSLDQLEEGKKKAAKNKTRKNLGLRNLDNRKPSRPRIFTKVGIRHAVAEGSVENGAWRNWLQEHGKQWEQSPVSRRFWDTSTSFH
jgi:hypothetical protein